VISPQRDLAASESHSLSVCRPERELRSRIKQKRTSMFDSRLQSSEWKESSGSTASGKAISLSHTPTRGTTREGKSPNRRLASATFPWNCGVHRPNRTWQDRLSRQLVINLKSLIIAKTGEGKAQS